MSVGKSYFKSAFQDLKEFQSFFAGFVPSNPDNRTVFKNNLFRRLKVWQFVIVEVKSNSLFSVQKVGHKKDLTLEVFGQRFDDFISHVKFNESVDLRFVTKSLTFTFEESRFLVSYLVYRTLNPDDDFDEVVNDFMALSTSEQKEFSD